MYRTKLACSLLVLGIGACQRADDLAQSRKPLVDENRRPAVGNIGQTGRPDNVPARVQQPAAVAAPLATVDGSPAVGNIGQTGRPTQRATPRRVVTVPRERRAPRPVQPEIQSELAIQPLVREDRRPAVGNVPRKGRLSPEQVPAIEPLVREDGRPAVGNTARKGGWEGE